MTIHEYILKFVNSKFIGKLAFAVTFKSSNKNEIIKKEIYSEKILGYFDGECS